MNIHKKPLAIFVVSIALQLLAANDTQGAEQVFFRIAGPVATTITGIAPDGTVTWTNAEIGVTCIVQTATNLLSPTNWNDYVQVPVTNGITRHWLFDPKPPSGMVFIPAGNFTMGDTLADGNNNERPTHTVHTSAFYMDRYELTKAKWDEVYNWAIENGYQFDYAGDGKAANHPVHTVNWYDAVKWCNARSEKEGKTPAYYIGTNQTTVYRSGQTNVENSWVKWNAGYRLPTEAEWENAARGGLSGKRFPWGDKITHNLANYYSNPNSFDTNSTSGYHPMYNDGIEPFTSPVGAFAANGYGLYDMTGNVWELCWDWHGSRYYDSSPANDPRGPELGSFREVRGGSWDDNGYAGRVACRHFYGPSSPIRAGVNRQKSFRSQFPSSLG